MADEQVAQFVGVTGASQAQAQFWLESSNGDVELAVASYFEQQQPQQPATANNDADADMSGPDDDSINNNNNSSSLGGMPGAFTLGGSTAAPSSAQPSAAATTTGPTRGAYTLSGEPAPPIPASWQGTVAQQGQAGSGSSSRSNTPSSSGFRTSAGARIASLSDFNAPSAGPSTSGSRLGRISHNNDDDDDHGHDHDDDVDDDKDPLEYFAGGEKSGLSLQNPNARPPAGGASDVVKGILRQAVEGTNRMAALRNTTSMAGVQPLLNVFRGSGHTLGSEDEPSKVVPDPEAREDAPDSEDDNEEPAVRNLTFWEDGFSIEDGDLMRYDDPANAGILAAINAGRAPLSLLNVRHDQPVELRIAKRLNEKWTRQAPAPKKAFEGQGNRLGSTTPTFADTRSSSSGVQQQQQQSTASTQPTSAAQPFEVDQNSPTTQLQIRLRDGFRLVARFNHTHTVGDIRRYINASTPGQSGSSYVLQTTFPSRELTDESQTLSDAGLLGSVVVQKGV
ncbi:hypothetical protein ACM66B_003268 [Microbotryomycetes sp. NB124-2]